MEPLDLSIVVHPDARFSGTIEIGDERFVITDLPGTFTHYWGRRLDGPLDLAVRHTVRGSP